MEIALFHLYDTLMSGGTLTYTAHLYAALERMGVEVTIYRIRPRTERTQRAFGAYLGLTYRNVSPGDALKIAKRIPSILSSYPTPKALDFAPGILDRLVKAGMRVIMHDSRGYDSMPEFFRAAQKRQPLICIRESMQRNVANSIFIPHPYCRLYTATTFKEAAAFKRPLNAISTARVTFAKRSHELLEANRTMPRRYRIRLRGGANRMYVHHVLEKKYPEIAGHDMGFPLEWHAGAKECAKAAFAVDFSIFPADGGGSQYTFLEAWDAGAVNVLHKDWFEYGGEMRAGKNCLAADGPRRLATLLSCTEYEDHGAIVEAGFKALRKHAPATIAAQYKELFK